MCAAGKYCVEGSDAEVNCPAGTFSVVAGLGAVDGCLMCSAGTACVAGSAIESPCALGTHAPNNGSTSCDLCPAGSYQDETGQVDCKICTAGHFCPEGSTQLQPCPSGKYADTVGLRNASQCSTCPLGSFCIEGSPSPTQCFKGTIGAFEGLTGPFLCQACIAPATNEPGRISCDQCNRGFFLDPSTWNGFAETWTSNSSANRLANCGLCLSHATCENGAMLATVNVTYGHWRLTSTSRHIVECHVNDAGVSSCMGGAEVGEDGAGYCEPGHHGPLCELCDEPGYYFVADHARCVECPEVDNVVGFAMSLAAFSALIAMAVLILFYRPPKAFLCMSKYLHLIILKAQSYALLPKLKILFALYQIVVFIPSVYEVSLPEEYYRWMKAFVVFSLDWDEVVVPGACLPGGFSSRLILRGIIPLIIMIAAVPVSVVRSLLKMQLPFNERLYRGLLDALSVVLFLAFCFCASVSSGLFAAWSCSQYDVMTPPGPNQFPVKREFLSADVSIECDQYTDAQYSEIRFTGWIFIWIWPVGMPILYAVCLVPVREHILHMRSTALVRATAILHREYEPEYFFWEPIFLLQRLTILGFMQWIPRELALIRIQGGLIFTLLYTIVLMFVKPYKRYDLNVLAITSQISLIAFFISAINLKMHSLIELGGTPYLAYIVTGFRSASTLVAMIFGFNLLSLGIFGLTTIYQAMSEARRQRQLEAKKRFPTCNWEVAQNHQYSCFLSHSKIETGPEARYLKDTLELMLGCSIFLDSTNLSDLRLLFAGGVAQSEVLLVLLSPDVITRPWCLLEILEAVRLQKHVVFLEFEHRPFSFDKAIDLFADLENKMPERNPSCLGELRAHLIEAQLVNLQDTVLNLLQTTKDSPRPKLNMNGSPNQIQAQLMDLCATLGKAAGHDLVWKGMSNNKQAKPPGRLHLTRALVGSHKSIVTGKPAFFVCAFDMMWAGGHAQRLRAAIESELGQTCHVKAPTTNAGIETTLSAVEQSKCLLLLQTRHVLSQPWVLLAVYRAIFCHVPIVCVYVDGEGYDFVQAKAHLEHLGDRLSDIEHEQLTEILTGCTNPHATSVIQVQEALKDVIPVLISVKYNASGSENELRAAARDVSDNLNLNQAGASTLEATLRQSAPSERTLPVESLVTEQPKPKDFSSPFENLEGLQEAALVEEAEDTYRVEELIFTISDEKLGVKMRTAGELVLIAALKPGSQAEELGVPVGGKITSINGEVAANTKEAIDAQLKDATRPTSLLVMAPDPRALIAPHTSAPPPAPETVESFPTGRGFSIELMSDRFKQMFDAEAAVSEANAADAQVDETKTKADGTEDPMPESNLFQDSILDA